MNKWGLQVFRVAELSGNRPLTVIMHTIFQASNSNRASFCVLEIFMFFVMSVVSFFPFLGAGLVKNI